MYEIPVALFYSALFLIIIYRSPFFRAEGIPHTWLSFAFFIKIIFGVGNLLIWYYIIGHGDSLNYFSDGRLIYNTLPEHPGHFLQLTFGYRSDNSYPEDLRYVSDFMIYSWNNVEYTMVRINAILDLLTLGSAFGNVIILAFLSFCASVTLFKMLVKWYAGNPKLLFALFFLLPSVIFWSSGLLKEGLAIACMSVLWIQLLCIEKLLSIKTPAEKHSIQREKKNLLQRSIYICIMLFCIFLIRDFLLLLIIPNLLIWIATLRRQRQAKYLFAGITISFIVILCIADVLTGSLHIATRLQTVQTYFNLGAADPDYHFYQMNGTLRGLIIAIPYALNNILFRPNALHSMGLFRLYESVELLLIWSFLIFCMLRKKKQVSFSPALLFMLFFSLELLYIYGLIVTDADTLSRYRTLPLFFLLVLAALMLRKRPDSGPPLKNEKAAL